MEKKFGATNDPNIISWLEETFRPEDSTLAQIRKNSDQGGLPAIAVGPFDGKLLTVLAKSIGAKKLVEIGTLGGYSGVCLLRGAGPEAKLFSFELSPKNAEVAQANFQLAGLDSQVEILIGRADEKLKLIEQNGPFDLVFIDADKNGYPEYLEWAHRNLRKGGVVLGDNTLAWNLIARDDLEDAREQKQIASLRKFNQACGQSEKWTATMIPTGEGLTFAVKN